MVAIEMAWFCERVTRLRQGKPPRRKRQGENERSHESSSPPAAQVDAVAPDDLVALCARDAEQAGAHVEPDRQEVTPRRTVLVAVRRVVGLKGAAFALERARERVGRLAVPREDAAAPEVLAVARSGVEYESTLCAARVSLGQGGCRAREKRNALEGGGQRSARRTASESAGFEKSRRRSRHKRRGRGATRTRLRDRGRRA